MSGRGIAMPDQLYRKVGRRYIPVQEFPREMPGSGIYLIYEEPGISGFRRLLKLGEPAPILALDYLAYVEELSLYLVRQCNDRGLSFNDLAEMTCKFFAEKVGKR